MTEPDKRFSTYSVNAHIIVFPYSLLMLGLNYSSTADSMEQWLVEMVICEDLTDLAYS